MTKEQIMKCFLFRNQNEQEEAEQYLRLKGISFHKKIMIYLGFDFNETNNTIDWNRVSSLLRYDKRLRDKIYVYLATLEEYIRAFISNKYEDISEQDFWLDKNKRKKCIKDKIELGIPLYDILEGIEFGELIMQLSSLPQEDISLMFENDKSIYLNLEAIRVLRNAVSHHVFLHGCKFLNCCVDGITNNTLEHNISNLRQLLPIEYRFGKTGNGGITEDINNCKFIYKPKDTRNLVLKEKLILQEKDIIKLN